VSDLFSAQAAHPAQDWQVCLAHPLRDCQYAIDAGDDLFHELARQKECRILEGHLLPDHVHMCIEIPPKHAVVSVVGFLKGKSAIAIARQFGGKQRNFEGENFWARGYAVSTVGFEEEVVRRYICEQEASDQSGRF
jgi:putative transposase